MNTTRNLLTPAFCFIALFLSSGCSQPHPLVGQPAPDFSLDNLAGIKVTLSEQRGHVVLLNFWAVGCSPCRAEIPHLVQLQEKYGKDGFRVIGINAWEYESSEKVQDFVAKEKLPYTVLRGSQKFLNNTYKGNPIPHNFLIDKQGKIVWSEVGFDESELPALERRIEELLGQ